jgi:hypothetical protein
MSAKAISHKRSLDRVKIGLSLLCLAFRQQHLISGVLLCYNWPNYYTLLNPGWGTGTDEAKLLRLMDKIAIETNINGLGAKF